VNEQEFREALDALLESEGYLSVKDVTRLFREAMEAKDAEIAQFKSALVDSENRVQRLLAGGEAKDRRIAELDAYIDTHDTWCQQGVRARNLESSGRELIQALRADLERVTKERDNLLQGQKELLPYPKRLAELEREASALREELAQEREKRQAVERVHVESLVQMRKQLAEAQREVERFKSYEAGWSATLKRQCAEEEALRAKLEAANTLALTVDSYRTYGDCDGRWKRMCEALASYLTPKESPNE